MELLEARMVSTIPGDEARWEIQGKRSVLDLKLEGALAGGGQRRANPSDPWQAHPPPGLLGGERPGGAGDHLWDRSAQWALGGRPERLGGGQGQLLSKRLRGEIAKEIVILSKLCLAGCKKRNRWDDQLDNCDPAGVPTLVRVLRILWRRVLQCGARHPQLPCVRTPVELCGKPGQCLVSDCGLNLKVFAQAVEPGWCLSLPLGADERDDADDGGRVESCHHRLPALPSRGRQWPLPPRHWGWGEF